MKKLVLSFLFAVICTGSNAQVVRESLEGVKCTPYQDGILVTGYDRTDEKAKFIATLYDKELNVVKVYTKEFDFEIFPAWSYIYVAEGHVDVYVKAKPDPYFIKLSDKLEELSYIKMTEQLKNEDKAAKSNEDKIYQAFSPVGLQFGGRKDRIGIVDHRFIKENVVYFNEKEQSLCRYSYKPNKMNTYYHKEWETPVNGSKKAKSQGTVFADENDIVTCFYIKGDNGWEDNVLRFNAKTGTIKYQFPVKYASANEKFYLSNAFFDKQTENIVVAGELDNAIAIMVYDKNGRQISSKQVDFPEYNVEVPKKEYDLKDKSMVAWNIGKLSNGNYFVIYENSCMGKFYSYPTSGGAPTVVEDYVPVGFSYFELTDKNEIVNVKIQFLKDFKDMRTQHTRGKGDELYVMMTKTNKTSKTPMIIDFGSDKEDKLTMLAEIDYRSVINNNYNPGYDADFYNSFVIDENHAITYYKMRASNIYELKSIQIR